MLLLTTVLSLFMMMPSDAAPVELALSELRWEKRVVLIFAADASDEKYQQQLEILEKEQSGIEDRRLVRVMLPHGQPGLYEDQPLSEKSAQKIRQRFGPEHESFSFVLLGLDGGEKLRSETPVSAERLFARIDRMPMRMRELENRN